MGSLAQKLTVLGKPLYSVQLAPFSAKCLKLRIFHTTGSCSGDNSQPESIDRNYIYLSSGLSAGFSRTTAKYIDLFVLANIAHVYCRNHSFLVFTFQILRARLLPPPPPPVSMSGYFTGTGISMYTVVIWNWAVTYGIGESGAGGQMASKKFLQGPK